VTSDPEGRRVSFQDVGRKLDSKMDTVSRRVSEETEKAITYVNNEVVPAMRNGSSKVLREASQRLQQLAEYLDRAEREKSGAPADEGNPSPS